MTRNNLYSIGIVAAVGILFLILSSGASAQNMVSPAWSMWVNMSQRTCIQRGRDAVTKAGMTKIDQSEWLIYAYANNMIVVIKCIADDGSGRLINPNATRLLMNIAVSGPSTNGSNLTQLSKCIKERIVDNKSCWDNQQTTATLSTNKSSYRPNEPITVNYQGMPGKDTREWITIVPAGSSPGAYNQWFYTEGNKNGSLNFTGLQPGTYEVRAYNYNSDKTTRAVYTFTVR